MLKIEDLIGLKVQAIANSKKGKSADLADIESLVALHHAGVDWSLIEEYFALLGLGGLLRALRRHNGPAQ